MSQSSPTLRASASPTTGRIAVVAAALALIGLPARADWHDAEIKAFASTMAIACTVRETCPGIEPDEDYLEGLRQRLHVVEADHQAFAPEAHAAAEALKLGIAEARAGKLGARRSFGSTGRRGR